MLSVGPFRQPKLAIRVVRSIEIAPGAGTTTVNCYEEIRPVDQVRLLPQYFAELPSGAVVPLDRSLGLAGGHLEIPSGRVGIGLIGRVLHDFGVRLDQATPDGDRIIEGRTGPFEVARLGGDRT